MSLRIALAAAGAAVMLTAMPARADITYFDGGPSANSGGGGTLNLGGGVQTGTTGSGTVGNIRTYTNGPVIITATALSLTGTSTQLAASNLGYHGTSGLAVCNSAEGGSGCSTSAPNPMHQADNSGGKDFILLRFNAAVTINDILVQTFSTYDTTGATAAEPKTGDTDITYYVGNVASNVSLIGKTLADLTGNGVGQLGMTTGTDSSNGVTGCSACNLATVGGSTYNTILIGAPPGQSNDAWKLQYVSYTKASGPTPPGVPEPMSLALLATGLLGLGAVARRRRAA